MNLFEIYPFLINIMGKQHIAIGSILMARHYICQTNHIFLYKLPALLARWYQPVQPQLPYRRVKQVCVHGECSWLHSLSLLLCCVCVCMVDMQRVPVCYFGGPTDHCGLSVCSRSAACRGKNAFLKSYISTCICLMSSRVERCIEHVRRPLAMRCG